MKNKINNKKLNKGFSLLELLVVILIIGLLAAIALPQYQKVIERSKMHEAVIILKSIAEAQQRYYMIHNRYLTCDETEGLDIDIQGSDNCSYSTCKCKDSVNFIYSFSNRSGDAIALAHRKPLYKYNIHILPEHPNKIGCTYSGNSYKPSKIQEELCKELKEKGYL